MVTLDQLLELEAAGTLYHARFHRGDGRFCDFHVGSRGALHLKVREYRVSGKLRRWKRTPLRFELPVKHGFYGPSDTIEIGATIWHHEDDCPALQAYRNACAEKYNWPLAGDYDHV